MHLKHEDLLIASGEEEHKMFQEAEEEEGAEAQEEEDQDEDSVEKLTLPPQPPQRILAADRAASASGPAAEATPCSSASLLGLLACIILSAMASRPVLYMLMNLWSM